jgi:hypothetical protein
MEPDTKIILQMAHYVCVDGSINRAELVVSNYLIGRDMGTARKILERNSFARGTDYEDHRMDPDGDVDSVVIYVTRKIESRLYGAILELAVASKDLKAKDDAVFAAADTICKKMNAELIGFVNAMNRTISDVE